jgi:predicted MFS family arabinose efflux permease
VSFIQFVHALEFMALTPLFVWMAVDFDVPATYAGYAASAYMGGAALSGVLAARWMHRAALKPLLLLALILLAVLTALGSISSEFGLFILLRLGAGLLGGFLMSAATTLLLHGMNAEQRTDAIAIVVSAFALVSVAGMPATLFIAVLCLLAVAIAHRYLPSNPCVAAQPSPLALGKEAWRWLSLPAIAQAGSLLLIPVLIPVLALRYDTQAQQMPVIFMLGGIAALIASRLSATGIKKWGETRLSDLGTLILLLSLIMLALGWGTAHVFMILFMTGSYTRLVCASARSTSYPTQAQRGRFMALQTTGNHIGSFIALAIPSLLLRTLDVPVPDLHVLLLLTAFVALVLPIFMRCAATQPLRPYDQAKTIDH